MKGDVFFVSAVVNVFIQINKDADNADTNLTAEHAEKPEKEFSDNSDISVVNIFNLCSSVVLIGGSNERNY